MSHDFALWMEEVMQPVAILWCIALLVTVRLLLRRRWRSGSVLGCATILLWVIGATPLSPALLASLEAPFEIRDWSILPEADAVLMLGGTLSVSNPDIMGFEVGGTFDRAITAVELVRRKKATALVLAGGGDPENPESPNEVKALRHWINTWGIDFAPVYDLGACRNTNDEAEKMQKLMKEHGWSSLILVTSAFHMGRAQRVFLTKGISVKPAACDFYALNESRAGGGFNLVPRPRKLIEFEQYLHEWCGIIYYRWRGWI